MAEMSLTVSQLNEYVHRSLQMDPMLMRVTVRGEISNLKYHQSGMLFFTLKDERAALSCMMFQQDALGMRTRPFEGMRAIATGSVGLYVKSGQYRLTARTLQADGMGVLYERLQLLTEKLAAQGLFAQEKKRPLPDRLDTLGVVTSPTGAVLHDILNVARRRNPGIRILLCPVRVQGAGASEEIARGIEALGKIGRVSVIIVARGGGSIEDLWEFNEERVARACRACPVPVISAVGHETDHTLCDLARDMRAPTPSAAAELAVPVRQMQLSRLADAKARMTQAMHQRMQLAREAVREAERAVQAHHPRRETERRREKVMQLQSLLTERMRQRFVQSTAKVDALCRLLSLCHPGRRIEGAREKVSVLSERLLLSMQKSRDRSFDRLSRLSEDLKLLSPYAVLGRGYTIIEREGHPVTSARALAPGDGIRIRFADGAALASVNEIETEERYGTDPENSQDV